MSSTTVSHGGKPRGSQLGLAGFNAVLCLALLVIYGFNPDELAGLTIYPGWFWMAWGILGLVMSRKLWRGRVWRVTAVLWIAFTSLFVEESRSLARSCLPLPPIGSEDRTLRIVTMNCGDGGARGIEDLLPLKPDLVLVQEGPSAADLAIWTEQLYGKEGALLWGVDCWVLGRGRLSSLRSGAGHFNIGKWQPTNELAYTVVSLRLSPPPVRFDVWNPDYWRSYCQLRERHRRQMSEIQQALGKNPAPAIVAGDFNSPARDPASDLSGVEPLQDAFTTSGRGWGNTIINRFPFHRIDRVWIPQNLLPLQTRAIRTRHSDHRLTCCDVLIQAPTATP